MLRRGAPDWHRMLRQPVPQLRPAGVCGTHGAVHVAGCLECATHQPPRLQGARTTALPHYDRWFTHCYNQLPHPSLVEYWGWMPPTVLTHAWSNVLNDQKNTKTSTNTHTVVPPPPLPTPTPCNPPPPWDTLTSVFF